MIKRILYLILLCLTTPVVQAQQHSFFTHYSTEDGLSQNTMISMLQDHRDNLWFATWDGISRFGGYSFETYKTRQGSYVSLTNSRADWIYEDRHGFLQLLAYDSRVHRFDPKAETFKQVPAAGEEGSTYNIYTIQVLPDGTVWLLARRDGAIHVVTLPQKNYTTKSDIYSTKSGLFPTGHFCQVYQDKTGSHWLLVGNSLGVIYPGEQQPVNYFVETKEKQDDMNQAFYVVQEYEDDTCFASDGGRIWCYQEQDGGFRLLELPTKARITSIHTVNNGSTVVTTDPDGFFLCNLKTNEHTHYSPVTCKELSAQPILSAYVDYTSEVWFEQEEPGVVVHFNPATGAVRREQVRVGHSGADRSRPVFHIHEDARGHIWVHPYGGGFFYFDRDRNCLVPFYDDLGSNNWRFSNKMHAASSDKQGNLRLYTRSKRLEKVTFRSVPFSMLTPVPHEYESLSNEMRSVCEDKQGDLWVGLKDGAIHLYDSDRKFIGHLAGNRTISMTGIPMEGTVYFVIQDPKGIIWTATKGNDLVRVEQISLTNMSYKLTRYQHDSNDIYSLSGNNVYCVYEDHHDRIWATAPAGGINYISQGEHGETVFTSHRDSLKGYPIDVCHKVRFITSDNNKRLQVGTTTGAVAFDENFKKPESVQFHHFSRAPNDTKSLSNDNVHWIIAAQQKELYLATSGGGLSKPISISGNGHGEFGPYSVLDGLSSDVLLSIHGDHKQNFWISTENGICKFVPFGERSESYDECSISFRVRFSEAASMLTSGGDVLFGTGSGLFMFTPDSIRKSGCVPPVVFSRLMIANEDAIPREKSILKVDSDGTQKLVLSHDENIFSVQYAALDYANPQNIQYAYILDGFGRQWTFTDRQRSATYTNLPKGGYIFRVRSTNSDGMWADNERILNTTILPSFWETPLTCVLYVCFVLLIIFVTVYILFTIYRLKHEVSVEQQISDIKLHFLTSISHRLRTPLILIAGPVEQVLKNDKLPTDTQKQLTVVERGTNRMLRLVNQILDFRKIQNKKMKMQVQQLSVIAFVRKIMDNFEPAAKERNIDLLFQTEKEALNLWVDADEFERAVFSLLSNAFKYTPNGKIITIFIREDEGTVSVGVQDQGIDIAGDKRKSLFVCFESSVDKNISNQASSDIDLSLVKELVEVHKATISIDSRLGEGSCSKVGFLKGKEHYNSSVEFVLEDSAAPLNMERTVDIASSSLQTEAATADAPGLEVSVTKEETEEGSSKELMLLVEDNQELRSFLHGIFTSTHRVVEASNGMEEWGKALKYLPDIIISDVTVPEKDNIEMTRGLRADITTSHVPIMLLTARTTIESKLEGLEYRVDDYITKPFSATYLQTRVESLLVQRKKLQNFYRDNLTHVTVSETPVAQGETLTVHASTDPESSAAEEPAMPEMSPSDRKFTSKLVDLMEQNMDNGELVMDDLARELAVNRSVFFKKLETPTGSAPIEFTKEMCIKRAARLIETGEFSMTQISYMVGINDPRYFSKRFGAQVSMTPTEYWGKVGR